MNKFYKKEWEVKDVDINTARDFIIKYHYAKGCSRTRVYIHGLYKKGDETLYGVVWWLPPTKVACQSVNKEHWRKVLSLSRMAIHPDVPKNACSFLLGASVKYIKKDGRFISLVTYADEYMGHSGGVYLACNWTYVGSFSKTRKWIDPNTGRHVSQKSTRTRTVKEMEELGYISKGYFAKHKYVYHLNKEQNEQN